MKQHILFLHSSKDELTLFLEALKEMSHEDGVKCTYAATTDHALDILRLLVPDYIFFQADMPSMKAMDFLQIIRDEPRFRKVKVYLYSEDIDAQEYNDLMKAGASGWIQKAENVNRLRIKLEMFIGTCFPSS